MKIALSKRGRLLVAGALSVGSAAFAWTQVNSEPDVAWEDETQAVSSTSQNGETAVTEEVLPEGAYNVAPKKLPVGFRLMANEDSLARLARGHRGSLGALQEEVIEGEGGVALDDVLAQQSSVRISAVLGGSGGISSGGSQIYAANARASLAQGGGGGGGGVSAGGGGAGGSPSKIIARLEDKPIINPKPDEPAPPKPPVAACTDGSEDCPPTPDNADKKEPKPKKTVAVDEPSTLALFSLGLMGLASFSRRNKKRA